MPPLSPQRSHQKRWGALASIVDVDRVTRYILARERAHVAAKCRAAFEASIYEIIAVLMRFSNRRRKEQMARIENTLMRHLHSGLKLRARQRKNSKNSAIVDCFVSSHRMALPIIDLTFSGWHRPPGQYGLGVCAQTKSPRRLASVTKRIVVPRMLGLIFAA